MPSLKFSKKKILEESGGIRLSVSTENGMFFSTHNRGKKYSFETMSLCEILFADDAEIGCSFNRNFTRDGFNVC